MMVRQATGVENAASLIRKGENVQKVLQTLREGLGKELSELTKGETRILTNAILKVGAKGPKGKPGAGPGETPRPEAKWLTSLTREEARTTTKQQGLSTPEQKAKVINALEEAARILDRQLEKGTRAAIVGIVSDFLTSARAKATLTPEVRDAPVKFFYDPTPGAPFGYETAFSEGGVGPTVWVNKVVLEMGEDVSPVIETMAHEAAHVMRDVKGRGFTSKAPYLERPHERSAIRYAKFIVPGKGLWFFAPAAISAAMQAFGAQKGEQ
jgi:hypothetical protein